MNQISKIQLHFQMQNEDFARNLYGRWDSFFANNVERILNEEVEMGNEELLIIDKLELDLGSLLEEEFDEQFPIRFRERLEESLIQLRMGNGEWRTKENSLSTETKFSILNSQFSILCHFLLHGTLPWNATEEYKDINHLFLKVLQESPAELKQFLLTYGHYTSLQERLVYQLKDPQLEKGVHLLEPGSANFIISYVKFVQVKHREAEQSGIAQSDYRNTVWFVVYSYLLTNRSSYFDKKSFITQTMLQLAGKYNLSFDNLLKLMTSELQQFAEKLTIPRELFQILSQLQKEFAEKQYRESSINAAKFYKTIYHSLQKKMDGNVPQSSRDALFIILSKTGSCRAFLQYLKEEEIIALVPVVIPNEGGFVIEVAHRLDTQKEKGELQGKAGGEFRLLKWQIIFPLLLESKGSSFNRKYFVRQVFSKVAARYNTDILLLLDFFHKESEIGKLDKNLQKIISEFADELHEKQSNKRTGQHGELFELIRRTVNQKTKLTPEYLKLIRDQLADDHFRGKIISNFSETELFELFKLLYPKISKTVLSFMENLDHVFYDKNIHNKRSSGFNKQKWNILLVQTENSFDLKKFMDDILDQAEIFYRIDRFELLSSFQEGKISYSLSYHVKQTVKELYYNEKKQWIGFILKTTTEKEKHKLIKEIANQESDFIKSYLQTLDNFFIGNKTFTDNYSSIKWNIVFDLLIGSRKLQFNKQYFIEYTLRKITVHYGFPWQEFLEYCMGNFKLNPTKESQEIVRIITELVKVNIQKSIYHPPLKPDLSISLKEKFKISDKTEEILLGKLQQKSKYLEYIKDILEISFQLRDYILIELKLTFDNKRLLQIFLDLSKSYMTLNQTDILKRMLKNMSSQIPEIYRQRFWQKLEELGESNIMASQVIEKRKNTLRNLNKTDQLSIEKLKPEKMGKVMNNETEPVFINNAGMVLWYPFIRRLFSMLEFTQNDQFKNKDAQIRAIYVLQYMVFGKTDFPEHELPLNKILAGIEISETIPKNIQLSQEEQETVSSMLESTIQYWDKLKNTTVPALQEAFLEREGKLEEKEDFYLLTVGEKAYDILMDSLPWDFRNIKYPWMKKSIQVKWR